MSSVEASSSAYRRFRSGGRTPCTRCKIIIPEGRTMEALPPRDGQPRWTAHRCIPTCKAVPGSPAPSSPNSAVFRQQYGGTPCSQCGKPIADGVMMKAEKSRAGFWRNKRHVSCPALPASPPAAAPSTARLDSGGKRTFSSLSLVGGGGSGSGLSGMSSPAKKMRTPTGAGLTTSPWTHTVRPRPQLTTTAVAAAAHVRAAVGAAHRGHVDAGDAGDGVEVVRQVSVEERIAENQRKQGVIDIGDDEDVVIDIGDDEDGVIDISEEDDVVALTPPSMTIPISSERPATKGGGGGGGTSRNLAATEGWTQGPPSKNSRPAKPESSASKSTAKKSRGGLPYPPPRRR